ncbi:hypothetical protein VN97_g1696 [Penicillium thymicola]|uniref:Uncharacterized protein n=1 Tax=Penicillium thymicola TaxID=293382 RepID=A0AAI9XCE7_PENTH|nr:hypothetical protein VN97_g1696 [Penicillium thymicola]
MEMCKLERKEKKKKKKKKKQVDSRLVNATKQKGYQNIMSDQNLRVRDGNATCRMKSRDLEDERGKE